MKLLLENWRKHLKEGQEDEFLETAREGIASLKEKFPNVIDMIGDDVLEQAAAKQVKHQAYAGGPGGWSDRERLLLYILEKTLDERAGSRAADEHGEEEIRSISDIWTGEDDEEEPEDEDDFTPSHWPKM